MRQLLLAMILWATVSGAPRPASAEGVRGDANHRAHVLEIEEQLAYVDLGHEDGVVVGSILELHHVILAEHPVTGRKVRDTFPAGSLEVVKVGRKTCVARASEEALRRLTLADEISLTSARTAWVDPWSDAPAEAESDPNPTPNSNPTPASASAASAASPAEDQAARAAALVAWQTSLGKPPEERLSLWNTYLLSHEHSPYARSVFAEIASLKAQVQEAELLSERRRAAADPTRRLEGAVKRLLALSPGARSEDPLVLVPPRRAYEGATVELAFLVPRAQAVQAGWVHYRAKGEAAYRRAELVPSGDGYLRAKLGGEATRPPALEYFVEVLGENEAGPASVLGSAEAPEELAIDASVDEPAPDRQGRSRVSVFLDYVDFDGGGNGGFDQYVLGEIDFMYRFRGPIWAMRLGAGTLSGMGGPKDVIDASPEDCRDESGTYRCRRVGFNYVYVELEHRFSPFVALMLRPLYGAAKRDSTPMDVDPTDEQRELFDAWGLRARLRLGKEEETNLALGIGLSEGFGTLFEAAFRWDVVPRFPVVLSAQVTDVPVPEDFGVRLIADVGWRDLKWVYPSVRIAYQARDLDHAGVSAGLAANFDW